MLFYYQNLGGGMSENGSHNNAWEGKIDSIHKDIRLILEHIARQTFINESHKNSIDEITKEVDLLSAKLSALENKSSEASGGLKVIRFALTLLAGAILGVCGWSGSQIIQTNSDMSLIKEKITRLEIDVQQNRGFK